MSKLLKFIVIKRLFFVFFLIILISLFACSINSSGEHDNNLKDTISPKKLPTVIKKEVSPYLINDTLNSIAQIIAGNADSNNLFSDVIQSEEYKNFSNAFSQRWKLFDSTRIIKLKSFCKNELSKEISNKEILFYPFSGPDILYADLFFNNSSKFVLIGLEPVGTLHSFVDKTSHNKYFSTINNSLHSILKFSFFRTISMSRDLKNQDVDGTIHLLFLFLNIMGNSIVSAKPITVDSLGSIVFCNSFESLKKSDLKTKGIQIMYLSPENKIKELNYFSLNATDDGLKSNLGFSNYLLSLSDFNTYLKGASYLLHNSNFSTIRNFILNKSKTVTQDDSGIAYRYFVKSKINWTFKLYGNYTRPISLFSNCYQKDLDSLYKKQGSKFIGFGIGYNFNDQNSNLFIARSE
jgi:hypothetical protein